MNFIQGEPLGFERGIIALASRPEQGVIDIFSVPAVSELVTLYEFNLWCFVWLQNLFPLVPAITKRTHQFPYRVISPASRWSRAIYVTCAFVYLTDIFFQNFIRFQIYGIKTEH